MDILELHGIVLKSADHAEFDRLAGKFACLDVIVRSYFVKPTFLENLFFGMHVRKLVKAYYI